MASNWWIDKSGRNVLKGVEGDPENPPIYSNEFITDLLLTYPDARIGFEQIVPTMLPEEQERYKDMLAANPFVFANPHLSETVRLDYIQSRWNTSYIRNAGPRGGSGV